VIVDPPLDPSADEARSWLRRELLHQDYHRANPVQELLTWLERQVGRGIDAASAAPPLSTFAAMIVLLLLLAGLAWLASRARRTARARVEPAAVLGEEAVTAAELRARAEAALAAGRHEEAVVEAFRALTARHVERGVLEESPGATAREVAGTLSSDYPDQASRVVGSAALFDLVRYGERPATREQAAGVLALDDDLAGHR
jgi:hypothetical protein